MGKNKFFLAILFVVPLSQMATDMYFPSLPMLAKIFNTNFFYVQLSLSFFLIGLGVSQLIYGYIGEIYGKKISLLIGIIIFFIATIICILSSNIYIFILGRLIQGIGIGAGSVIPKATLSNIYSGNRLIKNISSMTIVWALTTILSPMVGGYLQQLLGWQGSFYLLLSYSLLLFVLVMSMYPETSLGGRKFHFNEMLQLYTLCFKKLEFIISVTSMALLFSIIIVFNSTSSFLFQNILKFSPIEFGNTIVLIGLSYVAGGFSNIKLLDYFNKKTISYLAQILMLLGSLAAVSFCYFNIINVIAVLLPVMIIIYGIGMIYPIFMTSALANFSDNSGIASAFIGFSLMASSALFTTISSYLDEKMFSADFILFFCIVSLVFILNKIGNL